MWYSRPKFALLWIVGLLSIALPAYAQSTSLVFQRYSSDKLARAQSDHSPTVIMFDADWCPPCRLMEATTFRDPRVIAAAAGFVLLQADLSHNGAISDNLRRQFSIKGTPTFIFLDPAGQSVARVLGGMSTDQFLQALKQALAIQQEGVNIKTPRFG